MIDTYFNMYYNYNDRVFSKNHYKKISFRVFGVRIQQEKGESTKK